MPLPNSAPIPLHGSPWLDAARVAVVDIARQALGCGAVCGEDAPLPHDLAGALIPIVSNLPPVQIGLFASQAGCELLARALLGSGPQETLTRAEMVDAMGEIVNMLSGNVKARVARYANHAALGLPTFLQGTIEVQSNQQADVLPVTIGDAEAFVIVLHTA